MSNVDIVARKHSVSILMDYVYLDALLVIKEKYVNYVSIVYILSMYRKI